MGQKEGRAGASGGLGEVWGRARDQARLRRHDRMHGNLNKKKSNRVRSLAAAHLVLDDVNATTADGRDGGHRSTVVNTDDRHGQTTGKTEGKDAKRGQRRAEGDFVGNSAHFRASLHSRHGGPEPERTEGLRPHGGQDPPRVGLGGQEAQVEENSRSASPPFPPSPLPRRAPSSSPLLTPPAEFRDRIEVIQELYFPSHCTKLKYTPDGQYLVAAGPSPSPQFPCPHSPLFRCNSTILTIQWREFFIFYHFDHLTV